MISRNAFDSNLKTMHVEQVIFHTFDALLATIANFSLGGTHHLARLRMRPHAYSQYRALTRSFELVSNFLAQTSRTQIERT